MGVGDNRGGITVRLQRIVFGERPWDSAYHGPHGAWASGLRGDGQRLAEAVRASPTVWGTSWDGLFWYPHKLMKIQSFTAEVMLTLPDEE